MNHLSNDTLEAILPHLELKDLLSLRLTCKHFKDIIDTHEWDRRYAADFPLDTLTLDGSGMDRYRRRYGAKLRFRLFDSEYMSHIANVCVVDYADIFFAAYQFKYGPPLDFLALNHGAVIRCLDGSLLVCSANAVLGVLPPMDITRLRVGAPLHHPCLRGYINGEPVECQLSDLFEAHFKDESGAKPVVKVLEMTPDLDFTEEATETFKLLDNGKSSDANTLTPLVSEEPAFRYTDDKFPGATPYERDSGLVRALMSVISCPLDTYATLEPYIGVGAVGNMLYVVDDVGKENSTPSVERQQGLLGEFVTNGRRYGVHSVSFPHKIKRVGGFMEQEGYERWLLYALDVEGNLYDSFCSDPLCDETPFELFEPQVLYQDVADLQTDTFLRNDGTGMEQFIDEWEPLECSNIVRITSKAYLTAAD